MNTNESTPATATPAIYGYYIQGIILSPAIKRKLVAKLNNATFSSPLFATVTRDGYVDGTYTTHDEAERQCLHTGGLGIAIRDKKPMTPSKVESLKKGLAKDREVRVKKLLGW